MRRSRGLLYAIFGCVTVIFIVINSRPSMEPARVLTTVTPESHKLGKEIETYAQTHDANNVQAYKRVTPSLAELGDRGVLPQMDKDVLMLTRVPGAGAELLVVILQRLQGYNAFKHIRLPPGNNETLTTLQQELFVEEITNIIRQEAVPLSFDGDVRFLNFTKFARQSPTFVSLVRDPLSSRILQRSQTGDVDAFYEGAISHFCGQDHHCTQRNSKRALSQAKQNVERWYPVVGILEYMEETLSALESAFPYFFNGARRTYDKLRPRKKHLSAQTRQLDARSKQALANILADETVFYEWLKSRLLKENPDNG